MKQMTPVRSGYLQLLDLFSCKTNSIAFQPAQKRLADDTERRVNTLFDALNCETLSQSVVEHLKTLVNGA